MIRLLFTWLICYQTCLCALEPVSPVGQALPDTEVASQIDWEIRDYSIGDIFQLMVSKSRNAGTSNLSDPFAPDYDKALTEEERLLAEQLLSTTVKTSYKLPFSA